jgi:membrane AbrB-like protein
MRIRNAGLIVLGAMMGAWFTAETVRQIVAHLPGMLLVTGISLLFGVGAALITMRQTGISLASSLLGSTPGGFSQMVVLCDEFADADLAAVSMLQTIRLLSVVFIVPFLAIHAVVGGVTGGGVLAPVATVAAEWGFDRMTALYAAAAITGAAVAWRLSFPTPFMLGPLLGVAVLGVAGFDLPRTPLLVSAPAQICMGAYMGVGIDLVSLRQQKKLLLYALLGGLIVVASSLLSAWMLTRFYSVELTTAFLSAAPGGIAEMGLTAALIHADVSIVSAYQIFRLLFILLIVPYMFKWWLAKDKVIC